jgi:hypothetical protein
MNTPTGGLAISCPDKNILLQMNAILMQSLYSSSVLTTVTDSGILLPTGMSQESSSASMPRALMIPFDAVLWRTALDLQQSEESQEQ